MATPKDTEVTVIIIETTVPNSAEARRLAKALVETHLVACAQVTPINSHYLWEGKLQEDQEYRLSLKTLAAHWPAIENFMAREHPYDVPQLLALPVLATAQNYHDWVVESTHPKPAPKKR